MLSPFGAWVRAYRERNLITLRDMSRALGKSPSFMSALELGRKSVPISIVDEIADAYALTNEELSEIRKAAEASRTQAKVRFEDRTRANEREVAMLFARNFDNLTEDQTERIRRILEERDGGSER